jgi:hypothetical protein
MALAALVDLGSDQAILIREKYVRVVALGDSPESLHQPLLEAEARRRQTMSSITHLITHHAIPRVCRISRCATCLSYMKKLFSLSPRMQSLFVYNVSRLK